MNLHIVKWAAPVVAAAAVIACSTPGVFATSPQDGCASLIGPHDRAFIDRAAQRRRDDRLGRVRCSLRL